MRDVARPIWIITKLTFREAQRRRLLWVGLAMGVIFVGLFTLGLFFAYRDMTSYGESPFIVQQFANMFLVMGLYVVNFLVVVMTALTSVAAVSAEISTNTIHAIAAKPLSRWQILVGKWLGYAIMLSGYALLLIGGLIGAAYLVTGYTLPNLLLGIALMLLEELAVLSLALMGSTAFNTLANGVMVFMMYGLAFVGGWTEQIGAMLQSQTAEDLGILSSLLLPSEALWRLASYHMQEPVVRDLASTGGPFTSASVPSPVFVIYAVAYILGLLGVGMAIMERRDF
jgi:ABC-type transport system involved in multi-copper enzyme maturation permease subunit